MAQTLPVRLDALTSVELMLGEDAEETALLRSSLEEARTYIEHFAWCNGVKDVYFGCGVGGVVAVFLFRIVPAAEADEWLWVVCGDLPSAYLVTDRAPDALSALAIYCELMERWLLAVRSTPQRLAEAFPFDAAPTEENASLLERRLVLLRTQVIPWLAPDPREGMA